MKIRNLLMAGLATTALFSCSTDENVATESAAKEQAYMGLQISFPKSTITKADPQYENGLAIEQEFSQAVVILVNPTGNITDYLEYASTDFAPDGSSAVDGTGDGTVKNYLAKSAKIVTRGDAKVYVFLNPTADITKLKKANYTNEPVSASTLLTTEMTALTSTTGPDIIGEGEIANPNHFLMGNSETPVNTVTIDGTITNPTNVILSVERAAVKLVENTTTTTFNMTHGSTTPIAVTLKEYNYNNLNKRSFILRNYNTDYVIDPNFESAGYKVPTTAPWFDNDFFIVGNNDINKDFTNKITYCLENTMTQAEQYDNKTTSIVYKADIKINGSSTAATFYTYKNIIYTSYAALETAYNKDYPDPNQHLDKVFLENAVATAYAGTSPSPSVIKTFNETLYAKGIRCYYNGTCFYNWMIKHIDQPNVNLGIMEFGVVRNNVYYLAVQDIKNIGEPWVPNGPEDPDPTPVPDESEVTALIMSINVLPWTVRTNNINF